jgi:adhesin transport system membrane fusion protein
MTDNKKQPPKKPVKELKLDTKKKVDKKASKESLNDANHWAKIHKSTFSRQLNKLEAYGDKLLDTDDDLPLTRHLQLFTIVGVVFISILWANFAKLDEITRGQGKVVPSSDVQIIQHQEGGTVQALMVREGDIVESGQILMRLSDVGASSELGTTNTRVLGLMAKVQRLQAEAEGNGAPEFTEEVMNGTPESVQEELNAFRANKSQLDSQISVLRSQLSQRRAEVSEVNTRIRDIQRVISLTQQEMDMLAPLVARGSAPKRDVLQLEQQMAGQTSELNGLRASLPRANSAIN